MPAELGPAGPRDPLRVIYEQDQRRPTRSRLFAAAAAVLVLGAFAVIVYYAYYVGVRAGSGSVAPLIKAEQEPYKVKPQEPGGMEVPDQDKLIYNEVAPKGEGPGKKAEHLLPPPESPLPRPEPEAAPPAAPAQTMAAGATGGAAGGASAPAAPSSQAAAAPPAPAAQPEPAVPSNGVPAPAAAPPMTGPIAPAQPAPVPATPPAAAKSAAAAAPAKPAAAAAPVAAGAWRIQLAAMRSEDEAKHEWARLQKKHPDLLGKLSLAVQKVTLAGKGEFFRVQGGPLSDRQAAAALCERLKAAQVSCLAVKP